MKNVTMIAVLMLVGITGVCLADVGYTNVAGNRVMDGTMDEFVQERLERYESHYSQRYAWARPFAWGTGQYVQDEVDTVKFSWFAYSNTDAYLQFDLSSPMLDGDMIKIDRILDSLGRPWDVLVDSAMTMTWIGTSNLWMDYYTVRTEDGFYVDEVAVVSEVLGKFNNLPFFREMKVTNYLR